MKYVRLWADTHSTGLIDESGLSIPREATTITQDTWHVLQEWVRDYDRVIPLNEEERRRIMNEIRALDARGDRLLERIREEWSVDFDTGDPILLMHFSEGEQRYLSGVRGEPVREEQDRSSPRASP